MYLSRKLSRNKRKTKQNGEIYRQAIPKNKNKLKVSGGTASLTFDAPLSPINHTPRLHKPAKKSSLLKSESTSAVRRTFLSKPVKSKRRQVFSLDMEKLEHGMPENSFPTRSGSVEEVKASFQKSMENIGASYFLGGKPENADAMPPYLRDSYSDLGEEDRWSEDESVEKFQTVPEEVFDPDVSDLVYAVGTEDSVGEIVEEKKAIKRVDLSNVLLSPGSTDCDGTEFSQLTSSEKRGEIVSLSVFSHNDNRLKNAWKRGLELDLDV